MWCFSGRVLVRRGRGLEHKPFDFEDYGQVQSTRSALHLSPPHHPPSSVHGSVLPRWMHACVERESIVVSVGFSHCTSSSSTVKRSREEESREHSLPLSLRFLKK
ncbi:unnamed protein product [Pleuronectes platessa]|uniref:Uncharacterized protein n=1 Tax=Pleuronectes platessa TaxID=8262 RepID=A0A9N7ZFC4_PLEPL|nr:unnamed protein product [Pleuronectes platessa]